MPVFQLIRTAVLTAATMWLVIENGSTQQPLTTTKTGADGMELVLIPAGAFEMGSDSESLPKAVQWMRTLYAEQKDMSAQAFEDETPRHSVYLDAFYVDKYEV